MAAAGIPVPCGVTTPLSPDYPNGGTASTESPSNANQYRKACYQPLPPNTFLDAKVQVDDCTIDFYYHQEPLPGAQTGGDKWVCRTAIQCDCTDASSTAANGADAGTPLYSVQNIDTSQYDAAPSATCQNPTDFFSKLACGQASFSDIPQAGQWVIFAVVGLVVLILLVWAFSFTRAVTGG